MTSAVVRRGALALILVSLGLSQSATAYAQQRVASEQLSLPKISADPGLLSRTVTVHLEQVPLRIAFVRLATVAKIRLQYEDELLKPVTAPVSLQANNMPLGEVLDRVLAGTQLRAVPLTRDIVVIEPAKPNVQQGAGIVVGTVTDAKTKQPLKGVKIALNGTNRAETSEDGSYRIAGVSPGTYTLTAKLLGHVKSERIVTINDDAVLTVQLALESSAVALDQVVVTGTVVPTEIRALPNAITVITAKQLEERNITSIDQLFRGDVPGVFAQNSGTYNPLGAVVMFSRGATALSVYSEGVQSASIGTASTNPIKTYVDGVELANSAWLSRVDPKSIERIEILTGPQASTIYGSGAINGVMQIFTKRGSSHTPQWSLGLSTGWVENNFSPALAPQHAAAVSVSGIEGRMSYNVGGTWGYSAPWSSTTKTSSLGGYGGVKLDLPTAIGPLSTDISLRRTVAQNWESMAQPYQPWLHLQQTGWWAGLHYSLLAAASFYGKRMDQTLGIRADFRPTSWWSHAFNIGFDHGEGTHVQQEATFATFADSSLDTDKNSEERRSIGYQTSLSLVPSSFMRLSVTAGADGNNSTSSNLTYEYSTSGYLNRVLNARDEPRHTAGGFLNAQLGLFENLFLTYGLRAEWNPNYGKQENPNLTPRFGVAYTQDIRSVTAKLRFSPGAATRAPGPGLTDGWLVEPEYAANYGGQFLGGLPNPDLRPEQQRGWEGGMELYFGSRASLVVTRYDQKVIDLIDYLIADSVRTIVDYPGFPGSRWYVNWWEAPDYVRGWHRQVQYVNVGNIRNQGWELRGDLRIGPLTTGATYSWTKSRVTKINGEYRPLSISSYSLGGSFSGLPEHTAAVNVAYAQGPTSLRFDVGWSGTTWGAGGGEYYFQYLDNRIRLSEDRLRLIDFRYYVHNTGYPMVNFNGSHQLSKRIGLTADVRNVGNRYVNDMSSDFAVIGRQTKLGMTIR